MEGVQQWWQSDDQSTSQVSVKCMKKSHFQPDWKRFADRRDQKRTFFHITLISFWNNYYASWCPFRVTKCRHHGWRTGNEDAPLRLRLFHVCARFQRSKVAPQGSRIQPSAALSRLAGSLVLTDSVCGIQWWCWQKVASVEHQMQQPSCQVLPTIQHVWETHMLQRAHALVGN